MSDHNYTRVPQSESRPVDCEYSYRGVALSFRTDAGVFSKGEVDTGTRLLLEALPEEMSGEILDLGCGWGVLLFLHRAVDHAEAASALIFFLVVVDRLIVENAVFVLTEKIKKSHNSQM